MQIITSYQMRQLDAKTIETEGISSTELMERAGIALTQKIVTLINKNQVIYIYCGSGNNGGDGFVIGRKLFELGYNCQIYLINSNRMSSDCKINYERFIKINKSSFHLISNKDELPIHSNNSIIIDAIFGSGLNRKVEGFAYDVINHINKSQQKIISIDTPSGLGDENIPEPTDAVINANETLKIEYPFLSLMLAENYKYVGNMSIIKIGLDTSLLPSFDCKYSLFTQTEAQQILKPRPKHSHKGTFGHTLIIAGEYCKMGAGILCCKASHRTGSGLVTIHIPAKCVDIVQISSPETMVSCDTNQKYFSDKINIEKYTSIAVGPGIGTTEDTYIALKHLIQQAKEKQKPIVLDADALNIISTHKELLEELPPQSILTPHPKEFERLFGKSENNLEKIKKLTENSKRYLINIVLKGANTMVCDIEGNISFNTTGNPGMATAGSGDTLTGIIASLLSQKITAKKSTQLGVYLHGLAGDIAKNELGECGIIASDIIYNIPKAINLTFNNKK
ncbi:MAG: NAD(P)H-hydrate dehydratase [Bacteroidales bacterium]|nr:NAD(P)H-hydrate dehydratase [Bacteroidales bacterium]